MNWTKNTNEAYQSSHIRGLKLIETTMKSVLQLSRIISNTRTPFCKSRMFYKNNEKEKQVMYTRIIVLEKFLEGINNNWQ